MKGFGSTSLLASLVLVFWSGAAFAQASLVRHHEIADSVLVVKSERKLYLMKGGEVLREFDVSLGLAPEGPKEREGDFKTPEGHYYLETRNPSSDYFLSIQISYPNASDRARARAAGVDPGGQIMIHGLPNEPKLDERSYVGWDWTDGCIAVSNSDMIDIWLMTREHTPIEIRP
ncbi:MAG TPA: L,D-transpeptidase family protein [Gammaproteobacteria bacterium]